jgi:hypothetical protein
MLGTNSCPLGWTIVNSRSGATPSCPGRHQSRIRSQSTDEIMPRSEPVISGARRPTGRSDAGARGRAGGHGRCKRLHAAKRGRIDRRACPPFYFSGGRPCDSSKYRIAHTRFPSVSRNWINSPTVGIVILGTVIWPPSRLIAAAISSMSSTEMVH